MLSSKIDMMMPLSSKAGQFAPTPSTSCSWASGSDAASPQALFVEDLGDIVMTEFELPPPVIPVEEKADGWEGDDAPSALVEVKSFLHIREDEGCMARSFSAPELHRPLHRPIGRHGSDAEMVIEALLQRLAKWPARPSSQAAFELLNSGSLGSRGRGQRGVVLVGHPEFCSRPCAYFVHGKCRTGVSCRMCHEIHSNITLSKPQRRKLEALRDWELLMVIYGSLYIRERHSLRKQPEYAKHGIANTLAILEEEISRLHPGADTARRFLDEVAPPFVESLAKLSTSAILSFARADSGLNPDFCGALTKNLESIRVAGVLASLLCGDVENR
eukprot:s526_g19.t2